MWATHVGGRLVRGRGFWRVRLLNNGRRQINKGREARAVMQGERKDPATWWRLRQAGHVRRAGQVACQIGESEGGTGPQGGGGPRGVGNRAGHKIGAFGFV
jgi:hypothetical protein